MAQEWLSLSEAADMLGVHPSTVRSWANQGRLPVHRTQGGHRRFRRSEVDLYRVTERAAESSELSEVLHTALRRTRLQIIEGRLEAENWYHKLDEEARQQYRQSGRTLLQGLMGYLAGEERDGEVEARALGYEYASRCHRRGLSSSEAVQAFLFFRNLLLDAMLTEFEAASVYSPTAWSDLYRKVAHFTDSILITLIQTYEAYERKER